MSITLLDIIVIVIGFFSAFLAMIRGFSQEILSLLSWTTTSILSFYLYEILLPFVQDYFKHPIIILLFLIILFFFILLIIFSKITSSISKIIKNRFEFLDRSIGFIFGLFRGLIIVAVVILFINILKVPNNQEWIINAKTKPIIDILCNKLWHLIPKDSLIKLNSILEKY